MKKHNAGWFVAGILCILLMAAGVNIVGDNITANGFVNSISGYQVNGGAGTTGQTLCNGGFGFFDTPCNAGGTGTVVTVNGGSSLGTANFNSTTPTAGSGFQNATIQISGTSISAELPIGFYNTVDLNGSAQTQRLALNFSSLFTATDSSSPSRTSIAPTLAPGSSGALYMATNSSNPGGSTAPALYDGNGNLTPATTYTGQTCNSNGCYRIDSDGTIEQWGEISATGGGNGGTFSMTYPHSFTSTTNLIVLFVPAYCNLGSPSACAGGGGGSNGTSPQAGIDVADVTNPTIAWWDTNTAPGTIAFYWHAYGH